MSAGQTMIIGIDGGGTGCRAALVAGGARHEVVLGPANVATNFGAALLTIRAALDALAARAGIDPAALAAAPAHLGLAGVTGPALAARVAAALPLARATVTDDRPTTIAGALGAGAGAVAAIGTGSFVGRQAGGRIAGAGGWGLVLGDQASAAWLARRCLEEVLMAVDGLAPMTALGQAVLARHDGDPARIVAFSLAARPADFAAGAGAVVAAAAAGDGLGTRLMAEGADYIRRALAALGWRRGEALCLAGGLGPAYARWLDLGPVSAARGTALDGALALAARQGDGQANGAGRWAGERAGERAGGRAGGMTMAAATSMLDHLAPGDWLDPGRGPLYLQLAQRIEAGIGAVLLRPGQPLPPEREIAARTGTSRVTVRKAVADLATRGLIRQRQGSGSYVAPAPVRLEQSLSRLTSFSEDMARRGLSSEAEWLGRGLFLPSPDEVLTLGLGPGDMVARLNRLRRAEGRPMAIERAALPPDILPDPMAVGASLYAALGIGGHRPVRAVQKISAVNLVAEDAGLLGVAPGSAGLSIARISYLPGGRVAEFTRSLYRGDSYDFVAELRIREELS